MAKRIAATLIVLLLLATSCTEAPVLVLYNQSGDTAVSQFLRALDEGDSQVAHQLLYSTYLYAVKDNDVLWEVQPLSAQIYHSWQIFYREFGEKKHDEQELLHSLLDEYNGLVGLNQVGTYWGKAQPVYAVPYYFDQTREQYKVIYLEPVEAVNGLWYIKLYSELPLDDEGRRLMSGNLAENAQAFLDQAEDSELKALFRLAYTTQQTWENTVKAGFHNPESLSWSELAHAFLAAAEDSAIYWEEQAGCYRLTPEALNGFVRRCTGRTLQAESRDQRVSLIKDHYTDFFLDHNGEGLLVPSAPIDQGLYPQDMKLTGKTMLEDGVVELTMDYYPRDAEETGTSHRLLLRVENSGELRFYAYYITPRPAGEGVRQLHEYLAANPTEIRLDLPSGARYIYTKTHSQALLRLLQRQQLGERISSQKLEEAQVMATLQLRFYDHGGLQLQLAQDGESWYLAMLSKEQIREPGFTEVDARGIPYRVEEIGSSLFIYQLDDGAVLLRELEILLQDYIEAPEDMDRALTLKVLSEDKENRSD